MKTMEELQAIRDCVKTQTDDKKVVRVIVGMATCGIAAGAKSVLKAAADEVKTLGLNNVNVAQAGCIGICVYEPIVEVLVPGKEKITYVRMTPEKTREVINRHIVNGKAIEQYTYNYAVSIGEGR